MAFNPTTEDLWLEVRAAIAETEQHVEASADVLCRLTSRWYRKDMRDLEAEPENFAYAYASNMLPQLGMNNPEVKVEAARVVGHRIVAQAVEDGLNAWTGDVDFANRHQPVYLDFLRCRGVTLHYLEEDARFSRGLVTPAIKRIDPRRFFVDALAEDIEDAEFRGHWLHRDVDDILADEDANPKIKEKLGAGGEGDEGDAKGRGDGRAFAKPSAQQLGRQRVKLYSVWLRTRNTIRVLVEGFEHDELYPERPYYGSECGPYQLYDAYPVPGSAWPLAPLVAVQDQSLDLNVHARAMGRAAARRRTIGLVEAANPDLGQKLANAEDGEILPVKGITGQHIMIEIPGATAEQYQITEYVRNRLDRISGLTATVQGNVGAADTATEAKIADDALNNRVRYLKWRVMQATEASLYKIGWLLFHTEGIVIPVNRRDPYTGEQVEGLFFGGPAPTDFGATWDDFNIRVRLNTLQEEVNHQQNLLAFYQVFLDVMDRAPLMPWVRSMNVLRDMAAAFRVPDKADEWVIPELFGAFGQPDMYPPSRFMGGDPPPPAGSRGLVLAGGPRVGRMNAAPANTGEPFGGAAPGIGGGPSAGFGSPENGINRLGRAMGPRPGGVTGRAA